jgi:hypothetical protein
MEEKPKIKGKVAILVPNICNPDYRVIKQAEEFFNCGYEVRIYCRRNSDLPFLEEINGVTYIRRNLSERIIIDYIKKKFFKIIGKKHQTADVLLAEARYNNLEEISKRGIK